MRRELDRLQDRAHETLQGHPRADDLAQLVQRAEEILADPDRRAWAAHAIENVRTAIESMEGSPMLETDTSMLEELDETDLAVRVPWEPPTGASPKPDLAAPPEVRRQWLRDRLQMHVEAARERYDTEGLTLPGEEAAQADPQAVARLRGSRIDAYAKASVLQDPDLAELITAPDFVREPDLIDSVLEDWYDVTTLRSWRDHLGVASGSCWKTDGIALAVGHILCGQ